MRKLVAVAAVLGVLVAVPALAGQPAAERDKGEVTMSWAQFVKITGYDPATKGGQAVTIPWKEVEDLLGIKVEPVGQAATVALPWQEFKALLQWSIDRKAGKTDTPPTDFIIASSEYGGTLTDEGADIVLKAKIEVLRTRGWTRIPILPSTVALTKTTLPAGVYVHAAGKQYELLASKAGSIDVTLEFAVAVQKDAGVNRLTFQRVAATSSVIDLSVAREDVDVKVEGAQQFVAKSAAGKTQVAAALPAGAPLSVSWERALPKVEKAPTKLYAETQTLVAVAEGILLCQETVNVNVLHTPIRELKLKAPAGVAILTITGSGMQDWRADKAGEITVIFAREAIGALTLRITYEQPATASVEAPVIRPQGVEREKGFVGVVAVANVEIAAGQVTGATTIDARQLPADLVAMTNQPILLGFRYVADAFTLPLTIKKHAEVGVLITIVDSALFTVMQLNDGRRITKAVLSVRNNRNQFLRLTMPAGAEIWSVEVSGNTVSPAKDEQDQVLIPLVRSAAGARDLAAFPVDLVYIETPKEALAKSGILKVELPLVDAPVMHEMTSCYLPAEGHYRGGWWHSAFKGPMKQVEEFTSLATGPQAQIIRRDAARQVEQMQQQVEQQVDAQAKRAGSTPIRVRLPVNGKLYKFEKILALPKDPLWFQVAYSGWKPAE